MLEWYRGRMDKLEDRIADLEKAAGGLKDLKDETKSLRRYFINLLISLVTLLTSLVVTLLTKLAGWW